MFRHISIVLLVYALSASKAVGEFNTPVNPREVFAFFILTLLVQIGSSAEHFGDYFYCTKIDPASVFTQITKSRAKIASGILSL